MTAATAGEPKPYGRIAVLGAGAWGTALALLAARAGKRTTLWARRAEHAGRLRAERRNAEYLGEISLPAEIEPTADLARALDGADVALLVTPSRTIREMAAAAHGGLTPGAPLTLCAKGVEAESGFLMSEILAEAAPGRPVAALSGPTFAIEVAAGLPTGVTIASAGGAPADPASIAARLAATLQSPVFRPYVSDDVIGVEIGGALKNVIAIACGAADGLGLGANMRAALITRGLDEMKRLSQAKGGRRETVTGLAGLGDLTLTCGSALSRNLRYGRRLAETGARDMRLEGKAMVVEGAPNAVSITDLARALGVHLPICEAVRAMVHEGADPAETLRRIWAAPVEAETGAA